MVTISLDGQNAYVASSTSDAVTVFDRAPDGRLAQKPGTAGCISESGDGPCADGAVLDSASSVAVSPDGQNVYVTSDNLGGDGNAVAVGRLIQKPNDAGCISADGVGCIDGRAIGAPNSVTISPDGQSAYLATTITEAVLVFDRAPNGTLAQKPGTDGCIRDAIGVGRCAVGAALFGPFSVALSPDGTSAYVASGLSDAVAVFDREPSPPPSPPR